MILLQTKINSLIGDLYLVASEKGLKGVYWQKQPYQFHDYKNEKINYILSQTEKQLSEYFSGHRREFNLDLDIVGTPFQKKVWNQLLKIPYGTTFSYLEISKQIDNEKAFRAVGNANGKNPFSIIIPCHRVIASDGSLGGYAGGVDRKIKLLNLEKNRACL
ncbi:methylated-DNA--[protein]-cysteine S-methyltransferase [Silvanigrella paludirubra]|uniref:Methylated-DNA--protein-cysteine methyltransferase n=1 Tax=Silvanigrella paludirubra TaxID=2499159 RepID=A0A6N6VVT1_9BACT|nr:methylated-DNA--[protein]-cysteine S-methyltransferase [Silvanigrella paludirubra]KAB8040725.1 methylated-DNA--[protein]-cysteine S-methyltransferase [Silvanigrella paludirubra]